MLIKHEDNNDIQKAQIEKLTKRVKDLEQAKQYILFQIRELETRIENQAKRYEFEYPQSDRDYD